MNEFLVTKEHIKLLKNAEVRWEDCEFGAPSIDCKRPYGNSSVYEDMCEILDIPFEQMDRDSLRTLHEETETVLQIFLQTGHLIAGWYRVVNYQWSLYEEYSKG